MIRYKLTKILYTMTHVPFWEPWGFWKWFFRSLLFLLLLALFILAMCWPVNEEDEEEGDVAEQTEDGRNVHTGDVQITLRWDTEDDLDLHVRDPWFAEICFMNPSSWSKGELDVDANAISSDCMQHPIENIYWPTGEAPRGKYIVYVVLFAHRTTSPTHYRVDVKNGDVTNTYEGDLTDTSTKVKVVEFRHGSSWFDTH